MLLEIGCAALWVRGNMGHHTRSGLHTLIYKNTVERWNADYAGHAWSALQRSWASHARPGGPGRLGNRVLSPLIEYQTLAGNTSGALYKITHLIL